jgi:hypothetical protein
LDRLEDKIEPFLKKIRDNLLGQIENIKKVRLNANIKEEYKQVLEKLKVKGTLATGQEMSSLINAAHDCNLLVDGEHLSELIKEKVLKVSNLINDMEKLLDEQYEPNQQTELTEEKFKESPKKSESIKQLGSKSESIKNLNQSVLLNKDSEHYPMTKLRITINPSKCTVKQLT